MGGTLTGAGSPIPPVRSPPSGLECGLLAPGVPGAWPVTVVVPLEAQLPPPHVVEPSGDCPESDCCAVAGIPPLSSAKNRRLSSGPRRDSLPFRDCHHG